MTNDAFELRGLDELLAEISQWPDLALAAGEVGMNGALLYLHEQIPPYPPPPAPGSFPGFVSDKQRRWFFWALRSGRIQIPYVRGGTLGKTITTNVDVADVEITGSIGSNRFYAPWVVGKDYPGEAVRGQQMWQARIHQGRWWQFDEIIDQHSEKAGDEFVVGFWGEWERLTERNL